MNKDTLCYILILSILGILFVSYKLLKKKIGWRPFVAGTVIFVVAKQILVPGITSLLVQLIGEKISSYGIMIIQALVGAIMSVVMYLLVTKFYLNNEKNAVTAFSLAFGEGTLEMLLQTGYLLLSYAILLNAVRNGTIEELLLQQGYATEAIPVYVKYLSGIRNISLFTILIQGMVMFLSQFPVSCLLYRAYKDNNNRCVIYAFMLAIVVNLITVLVPNHNLYAGLAVMILLMLVFYCYVVAVNDNVIRKTYSEKK